MQINQLTGVSNLSKVNTNREYTTVNGVSDEYRDTESQDKAMMEMEYKEPSSSTVDAVVAEANQRMRMAMTRCEYSYDEKTKRVSIKVYDKENDKLIREVPPEKSLEMLQKMWELAGIMVDEKR